MLQYFIYSIIGAFNLVMLLLHINKLKTKGTDGIQTEFSRPIVLCYIYSLVLILNILLFIEYTVSLYLQLAIVLLIEQLSLVIKFNKLINNQCRVSNNKDYLSLNITIPIVIIVSFVLWLAIVNIPVILNKSSVYGLLGVYIAISFINIVIDHVNRNIKDNAILWLPRVYNIIMCILDITINISFIKHYDSNKVSLLVLYILLINITHYYRYSIMDKRQILPTLLDISTQHSILPQNIVLLDIDVQVVIPN